MAESVIKRMGNASPKGVLLLCSSDNTLTALAAILHQAHVSALTAQTSKDAWDFIKSGTIGCVVQDLTAPDAESLALFRAARTSQKASPIPFLFLVHQDFSPPVLDGMGTELAHDDWLGLPCSGEQFIGSIQMLMRKAELADTARMFRAKNGSSPELDSVSDSQKSGANKDAFADTSMVFGGQLGVLDVTKILSMVEPLRLTGMMTVDDGKRCGLIHFVQGAVRHAELNDIEGADALFLLFHMRSGAFRFSVADPTQKRTIEGGTMSLLLEGLRQMDEAKALIKAFRDQKAGRSEAQAIPAG